MKTITIDGNEACARSAYLFTEVAGIYPITPSSPMAENMDNMSKSKLNIFNDKVNIVEMQSEAGAAGLIHGSLASGLLTTTFTSSQGLLLMIPNMYKMAGEMLPCVMHVAARSLSTHGLSIFGDHQDIYACRATGFNMLASSSVQDASYLAAVAHLSAIKSSLPFMHFMDGFRTSHEINKINILDDSDYFAMLDKDALNKFRNRAINPLKPNSRGLNFNDDIYFQLAEAKNKYYDAIPDIVNEYMGRINDIAGTNYKPFNYYGSETATKVIIAMGSVCETIKEVVNTSSDYGLIEVHLYRPFSKKYLKEVLPSNVRAIAVLDRTKEHGSQGEPLYLDIKTALADMDIEIVGGRYGLSSKDTTPDDILAVYNMLTYPVTNFTIGIKDDVTDLSLDKIPCDIPNKSQELLIYGYGSDGMVSASKSLIKIVGDNTDKYVQGYFQYDSKKSGGVTISHLRFSNDIIHATYYISKPNFLVITKDNYLEKFDIVNDIEEDAIVLINTSLDDIQNIMQPKFVNMLINKNAKVYTIDANKLASKYNFKNKISTIMESAIFSLYNIIPYDMALLEMRKSIENKFSKKGAEIVNTNLKLIEEAKSYIKEVKLASKEEVDLKADDLFNKINNRHGNDLTVKDVLLLTNGIYEAGTSAKEKRMVSSITPKFNFENCLGCNNCSLMCPHGVIRSFLIDQEEYDKLPEIVKNRCKKAIGMENMYTTIAISVKDCTGCGICVSHCLGFKGNKALEMTDIDLQEQEVFDFLVENIKEKDIDLPKIAKNTQYKSPKFAFSGACAGCGETPYLKLLTQLFGDDLVIANATGCSSIYSGSFPSTPFTIPWASSLFEDNAEYGYGMVIANKTMKRRIKNIMEHNLDNENGMLFQKWINNPNDYKTTKMVYDNLTDNIPEELKDIKDYIVSRNVWCVGGDGWAYDIGFSGIDQILASRENINILVLDTQIYSNTGGQASKSTPKSAVASFASSGKRDNRKDLARIAMAYNNAYVAQVSLGANSNQLIKALVEANNYNGPSIVICYAPCISHGIKAGMENSIDQEKLATESGYFPIFRYHPVDGFKLDSKANYDLLDNFFLSQTRFAMLNAVNPDNAARLREELKDNVKISYDYYAKLDEDAKNN